MDPPTAGNVATRRQKEALKREELCRGTFDTNHANSASVVTLIRTCLPATSNLWLRMLVSFVIHRFRYFLSFVQLFSREKSEGFRLRGLIDFGM